MLFHDAMVQLQARVPMYRKGWDPQDGYVTLMPGMGHVWKIVLTPAPNAGNYMWSVADFLADDWEVYVLEKKAVEAEVVAEAV
jgi:hypothetical protein